MSSVSRKEFVKDFVALISSIVIDKLMWVCTYNGCWWGGELEESAYEDFSLNNLLKSLLKKFEMFVVLWEVN